AAARGPPVRVRAGRGTSGRVARRDAADRDPRGGERIPPARPRTRLGLAVAAVAAVAGVAMYGTLEADRVAVLVLALGAGSVVLAALDLRTGGGLLLEAVGAAAAVALLALVLLLARAGHENPER